MELRENAQTPDQVKNIEIQQVIQLAPRQEGERVGVEQVQFDSVLQNERQVDLSATTEETYQPTSSLAPSAQQEADTGKYQPVEVLNSEGEWISGYWVHKCLVVANLAGIERKYALYDERGDKYVFWGEIRFPKAK